MSIQCQGVNAGGRCATSRAEHEAKDNSWVIKMSKASDLDSFLRISTPLTKYLTP